ncbi:hypothetical protein BC332_29703 [Capsicum chinense]|nr:hypothetical protein BC332_29703 [Capsicum chinense]
MSEFSIFLLVMASFALDLVKLLELNSWQLLRLLQAQLPGLVCENFLCDSFWDDKSERTRGYSSLEENFCCLFMRAAELHRSWKSREEKRSSCEDNCHSTVVAYHDFLRTAIDQQLRLLELNSWQLLRLLQAQLPGLVCENFLCDSFWDDKSERTRGYSSLEENFCCLFMRAAELHRSWKSREEKRSACEDNCHSTVVAYHDFLRTARKQVFSEQNNQFSSVNNDLSRWHLDDIFILVHIVTRTEKNTSATVDSKTNNYIQICSILVILISGRILGGWHQGGVNWTNLPDISKWLEQMGSTYIKLFQLVSVIILINISLVSLMWSRRSKKNFMTVISLMHLFPGWLVLHYITKYQDVAFSTGSYDATLMAQIIYAVLGFCSTAILVAVPRYIPFPNRTRSVDDVQRKAWGLCFKDSAYVIGLSYVYYWSLLQLLLQQPVNSMPVLFLFLLHSCVAANEKSFIRLERIFSQVLIRLCYNRLCLPWCIYCVCDYVLYLSGLGIPREVAESYRHSQLTRSKYFSIARAREIDPNHSEVLEIIAITDILMLPESINGQPNYYAILNVPNYSDDQQVMLNNFKSLMELLRSNTRDYSRLANEAFMLVMRAYGVLANPIGADWHP